MRLSKSMRRAARFAYLCFFGAMLLTGGLNRFALFGTQRSASALRLRPVYGQRDFGAGSRMKIGRMGALKASGAGSSLFCGFLATVCGPSNKTVEQQILTTKNPAAKRISLETFCPFFVTLLVRRGGVGSSPPLLLFQNYQQLWHYR
jgi:hypothetical protein